MSPVCELNSSGTVTATNMYSVNGLASRNTSSGSTFYEFDQSGSVSDLSGGVGFTRGFKYALSKITDNDNVCNRCCFGLRFNATDTTFYCPVC
jgi:hypothetical protein